MDIMKTEIKHDSASDAIASISSTANSGEAIYVQSITASYDSAPSSATIAVKADGVTVWLVDDNSTDPFHINFAPVGLKLPEGQDLTIELSAGGAGVTGHLNATVGKGE